MKEYWFSAERRRARPATEERRSFARGLLVAFALAALLWLLLAWRLL